MSSPTADEEPQAQPSTIPSKSMPRLGMGAKNRGHFEDDWRARPTATHPWPVVLLHGTASTIGDLSLLGRSLRRAGWVVFAPGYGRKGTRPIMESASQVSAYIDQVCSATGCDKVIIVGHSQGGVVARCYLKYLGGAARVKHLVCLGSPNHGTTLGGLLSPFVDRGIPNSLAQRACNFYFGPAGTQQLAGSQFLRELNHPDEIVGDVTYTCIATKMDATVNPPSSCFLSDGQGGATGRVVNMWVQDAFSMYPVTHGDLVRDRYCRRLIRQVLEKVAQSSRHGV